MLDYLGDINPAALLSKHKDLLRKIERFSHVGHWRVDLVENTVFWSEEVYRIHGVTKDEFIPDLETAIAFYHPDDKAEVESLVEQSIKTQSDFSFRKRLYSSDGKLRYVQSYGECEVDDHGNVVALFGVFKDVTDVESSRQDVADSLSFIQNIVDHIPDMVFVKDSDLRIVFANKAFLSLYDKPKDQIIGHTTYESFPPEQVKLFTDQDHKALNEGFTQVEEQITNHKGETATYLTRKQSFENHNGKVFLLGVAADITKQKKQEVILRKIYQISADKGFSLDARINEILRLSCDYYNLPFGIVSRIHSDSYEVLQAYDAEGHIKAGDVFPYADTYCAFTFRGDSVKSFHDVSNTEIADHPCYRKFNLNAYIGVPLYVKGERYGTVNFTGPDARSRPFTEDEHAFIRMIAQWIGHEISEAQYLKRLRESEERYELAAKGSASALWDWDVEEDTIYWSGPFLSVLKHEDANEMPTNSLEFDALVHPDDRERLKNKMAEHFKTRVPFALELRVKRADGRYIWTYNRAQALWDFKGNAVRMCGSMTNIDDRKRAEEELQRSNQELEQYAGVVAHDLHQPLRAVQGFLDLLVMTTGDKLDSRGKEYIGHAVSAAEHMSVIIDELLEYSRYNAGQLEKTSFDSGEELQNIADLLQSLVEGKGGKIILNGPFPQISYDQKQFSRLVVNLIENAVKYGSEEPPVIKISADEDEVYWRFSIADNGIGIAEKYLDSIFDMFARLKVKTSVNGTGIGLAVCRKIVEGHGGKIKAESEEGRGTTFIFTVPKSK